MSAHATDTDLVVVPKLAVLTTWCEYFGVEPVPAEEHSKRAMKEIVDHLAGVASCYGWETRAPAGPPAVCLGSWITEQASHLIDHPKDTFGEFIQALYGAAIRARARRDTIEQLASLFEQGKLAEGNSIQHDVPAFIRAQIKEGE